MAVTLLGCKKIAMYPKNVNCEAVVTGDVATITFSYDGQNQDSITPKVEICLHDFKNRTTSPDDTFITYADWDGKQYVLTVFGLQVATTYYYRLYLSNTVGGYIVVDNGYSFCSSYLLPVVTTNKVVDIHIEGTHSTAIVEGSVTYDGGCEITDRGICWSTNPIPTIEDNHVSSGGGTGSFRVHLTGCDLATIYYARAFATNCSGTAYGEPISFETPKTWPDGVLPGLFSIGGEQPVHFSQGNLQYIAAIDCWQFASNQYEYCGLDNGNISSTNAGRIDLFGWGTSGQPHGAVCYQPWSTSKNYTDYYAYGNLQNELGSETGLADWGCNSISNGGGQSKNWRTLTNSEWSHILFHRETPSGIRYVKAKVGQVHGIILLPDDWSISTYPLSEPNGGGHFDSNIINFADWRDLLEANGAVFLPAAGSRDGTTYSDPSGEPPTSGSYWTSIHHYGTYAYGMGFSDNSNPRVGNLYRQTGASVRLVSPAP